MALDGSSRVGRRSLLASLAGALAGLAGWGAIPERTSAASGQPLVMGTSNDATSPTWLRSGPAVAFWGMSDANYGVMGSTSGSTSSGVHGWASTRDGYGVTGLNDLSGNMGRLGTPTSGVEGTSGAGDGLVGSSKAANKSGCYGYTGNEQGYGVYGRNTANRNTGFLGGWVDGANGYSTARAGAGVRGTHSDAAGWAAIATNTASGTEARLGGPIGCYARSGPDRFALVTYGKVAMSRSGVATVPAGGKSVQVPSAAVTGASYVLATLQASRAGAWVTAAVVNTTSDSITIYLNKVVSSATKVAWLVLDAAT
jgi:hypothetical protein